MNDLTKTYFNKAPLKEVACIFNFSKGLSKIEITKLIESHLHSNIYTEKEEKRFTNLLLGSTPQIVEDTAFILKNKQGNKILRINSRAISVHQLGKYSRWSEYSRQVYSTIDILFEHKLINIEHIFLKKVNSFMFDLDEDLTEHFNYYPSISTDDYFSNDDTHFLLNKKIRDLSQIFLRLSTKKIGDKNYNVIMEIMTNIVFGKKSQSSDDIKKTLTFHNNEMYKAFVSSLKTKAINLIK